MTNSRQPVVGPEIYSGVVQTAAHSRGSGVPELCSDALKHRQRLGNSPDSEQTRHLPPNKAHEKCRPVTRETEPSRRAPRLLPAEQHTLTSHSK